MTIYCGRDFSPAAIQTIRDLMAQDPKLQRTPLSRRLCELFGWFKPNGGLKDMTCRVVLLRMQADGLITLAPSRKVNGSRRPDFPATPASDAQAPLRQPVHEIDALTLRLVLGTPASRLWNEYVQRYHYLGYTPMSGSQLRYSVYAGDKLVALLSFGASAWKLAGRDRFIGWQEQHRLKNLPLVVNNARFLILPWIQCKGLASKILSIVNRQLPIDWQQRYGFKPVLLETFVQTERHRGTSYKAAAQSIFGFAETAALYDLTNTYFEGIAAGVAKAKRGHSKECRSDCPLVTLAMVLDGSEFPRRSRVFAGNASEPATLAEMLSGLGAPPGVTVVMDAGIATEANLRWLRDSGYHYVVVSRLRERQFDPAQATEVQSAGGVKIKIQRVLDEQGHALLYCHSPAREQKDRAIDAAKASGFEAVLIKLQAGLSKPRGTRDVAKIMERLGRAKQRYARAAQHYEIEISKDASGTLVRAITWTKKIKPGSAAMHPGVYCLRTTLVELDSATLWRTYTMLTNLESVFRSLKTDLGLRPVFHQIDARVEGHLFISVLAPSLISNEGSFANA